MSLRSTDNDRPSMRNPNSNFKKWKNIHSELFFSDKNNVSRFSENCVLLPFT